VFPVFLADIFDVFIFQKRGYLKGNSFKISMKFRSYQNHKYKNHTNGFPWQRVFVIMMMTVIMMMSPVIMMMSCVTTKRYHCVCVCTVEMQQESALEIQEERARGPSRQNTSKHECA